MTKKEYLNEIKQDLEELLGEYKLNNYKNQAFAWRLNASFNRTFDEKYLWNKALFLASNSCLLIQNRIERKLALEGLYQSAEIYEYLYDLPDISVYFDRDYLSILSALCYDLSGYQANAYCVVNRINEYKLDSFIHNKELNVDNAIIEQLRLILLKNIPLANYKISNRELNKDYGYKLISKALIEWYEYILKLKESKYIQSLNYSYIYFLEIKNTYLSHLIYLLKTRILLFDERSIWNNIRDDITYDSSYIWKKYIKLLSYDYYSNNSVKDIVNRNSIFEFWTSQLRAIESGLLEKNENFVVQMPTSAGKTFVAELQILNFLSKFPEKKCIYIAPFRALTNEKELELSKYYGKMGLSVSSLSGSYEIDEFQDVILSETDLLIATPEKIDLLLRINPDFFNDISLIVIDEGHIIGDLSTRATLLEFLIIRLRIKLPDLKTLFISAVMPPENANEYSTWLSGKEDNVLRSLRYSDSNINDEWEPTRKLFSYFEWVNDIGNINFQNVVTEDENTRKRRGAILNSYLVHKEFGNRFPLKNNKKESAAALAYKLSDEGNTLVFCAQVPRIKSVAEALLNLLSIVENLPERFIKQYNKKSSYYAHLWFGEDSYITKSIDQGIGIHFGDMPEQVRIAVEEDYRNGLLCVLLSTNTIGQGLNFPIKNLVFYETQIGRINNKNIYIQKRDFWNIIGRAGRAGKETEGKIIFIINSNTDRKLYDDFFNKENIEPAESFIFKIYDAVMSDRINKDDYIDFLSILSETYLLDLVTEEIIGTEYEAVIENIINNSLFKIQIDKKSIDETELKLGFRYIFKSFEENATFQEIAKYKETGLSFKSNKIINDFIDQHKDEIEIYVKEDKYKEILKLYLQLLTNSKLAEFGDFKLDKLNIKPIELYSFIESWIEGVSIQDLILLWINMTNKEVTDFHIYLSKALYYLYPWGVSSFLIIITYKLNTNLKDLPENIRNLASFMKYGLNNPTCCMARSIGIMSREISKLLYETSQKIDSFQFIKWLSNLTSFQIDSLEASDFEKDNIREVVVKLTPQSHRSGIDNFEFSLNGTKFNPIWSTNSKLLSMDSKLSYVREEQNNFDPYAILVMEKDNPIGYVPREYSKIIAAEIDIESTEYNISIKSIIENKDFNTVNVIMTKKDIFFN